MKKTKSLMYRAFCFWLPIPLGLWLYRKNGKKNEAKVVKSKSIAAELTITNYKLRDNSRKSHADS